MYFEKLAGRLVFTTLPPEKTASAKTDFECQGTGIISALEAEIEINRSIHQFLEDAASLAIFKASSEKEKIDENVCDVFINYCGQSSYIVENIFPAADADSSISRLLKACLKK